MGKPAQVTKPSLSERLRQLVDDTQEPRREERRQSPRVQTYEFASITIDDETVISCVIRDISEGGVRIKLEVELELPVTVRLNNLETGENRLCRVAWQKAQHAGLAFWNQKRKTYQASAEG
ncbi:MAG: PilZ domain-containing protein [Parvularculaceae bacterium]|nr:MAG: PilZ domain-containing protein [Parvularculaceae bacterium]